MPDTTRRGCYRTLTTNRLARHYTITTLTLIRPCHQLPQPFTSRTHPRRQITITAANKNTTTQDSSSNTNEPHGMDNISTQADYHSGNTPPETRRDDTTMESSTLPTSGQPSHMITNSRTTTGDSDDTITYTRPVKSPTGRCDYFLECASGHQQPDTAQEVAQHTNARTNTDHLRTSTLQHNTQELYQLDHLFFCQITSLDTTFHMNMSTSTNRVMLLLVYDSHTQSGLECQQPLFDASS